MPQRAKKVTEVSLKKKKTKKERNTNFQAKIKVISLKSTNSYTTHVND